MKTWREAMLAMFAASLAAGCAGQPETLSGNVVRISLNSLWTTGWIGPCKNPLVRKVQ